MTTTRRTVNLDEILTVREGLSFEPPCVWVRSRVLLLTSRQDYIDSMEGATKSALLCADRVLEDTPALAKAAKERQAIAATN